MQTNNIESICTTTPEEEGREIICASCECILPDDYTLFKTVSLSGDTFFSCGPQCLNDL
jgi:hypothetical protein